MNFGGILSRALGFGLVVRGPRRHASVIDIESLNIALHTGAPDEFLFDLDPLYVRMKGAFPLAGGWNPYAAVVLEGPEALRHYYRAFRPRSLAELYMLDPGLPCSDRPPHVLPWVSDIAVHKRTSWFYGPASEEAVRAEISRIEALVRSISKKGFRPERYGHVTGYFLRRGGELRFVIKGGTHRAAVAAALGSMTLTVTLRPGWKNVVDEDDLATWPLVASGYMAASTAGEIFNRYFDLDGSEWRVVGT